LRESHVPLPEYIALGRTGLSLLSGLWKWLQRNKRKLSPQEKLSLRAKWKPQFEAYLADKRRRKLRLDIIIRDMKRIDKYPEIDEHSRGISAWFRVGLIDTYEKGFMAGLRWESLLSDKETGELRLPNRKKGKRADISLMLTGYIPYENVESVDWDGDQYYDYPHIYCYFDYKGQPYERMAYCKQRQLDDHIYFTEVADYEMVRKLSKKRGALG